MIIYNYYDYNVGFHFGSVNVSHKSVINYGAGIDDDVDENDYGED